MRLSPDRERETLSAEGTPFSHGQWRLCGYLSLIGEAMLRLVLLVLYLIASSSASLQTKQGGSLDPLGLTTPPPQTDGGGGVDPLG